MASFNKHLDDLRWLFQERGLQHVHSWLKQVATLPGNGTLVTIGALEMDAAATPGFTAAFPVNTISGSGRQNFPASTAGKLALDNAAVSTVPPWQSR